jgi:hypothetical protein
MVTSEALAADIRRAEMAGADVVLVKPFLPETLQGGLERLAQSDELSERHGVPDRIREPLATSGALITFSRTRSRMRCHTHQRGVTTTPPLAPPAFLCPSCERSPLQYLQSELGGVSATNSEQWDYLHCKFGCGTFRYRQRTGKLQKI